MKPLRYFLVPVVVLAAYSFWQASKPDAESYWTIIIIISVVVLTGLIVLAPQIKWWYWKRHAPDLPSMYAPVIGRMDFYHRLLPEEQFKFRSRVFLTREATDFKAMGMENVPDDVQIMVAASAAAMSFYKEDFLYEGFETVVFYPHPFPSPQYDVLHFSELYVPEGTFIFTLEPFVRAFFEPQQYFHYGFYEYAKALQICYPHVFYPEPSWAQIEAITGFGQKKLEEYTGLSDLNRTAIGLTLYYTHRHQLEHYDPELLAACEEALNTP